jgi:hypothetical protein
MIKLPEDNVVITVAQTGATVGLCIFLASDFITGQIIYLDGGLTAVG